MKRLVLSSLILVGMFGSSAYAAGNTGTINFVGVLTATTCNYTLSSAAGAQVPAIDLGTSDVASFTRGTDVSFQLVPDQSNAACKKPMTTGTTPAPQKVSFEIVPAGLDAAGVINATGTAKNVSIELSAKDKTGYTVLTAAAPRIADVDIDATTGAIPLKAAMVKSGTTAPTAGSVAGGAIFAITYN